MLLKLRDKLKDGYIIIILLVIALTASVAVFLIIPMFSTYSYKGLKTFVPEKVIEKVEAEIEKGSFSDSSHIKTPESVKALYMSQCAASTQSFRDRMIDLLDTTELNSIVIDIKDYTGTIAFTRRDPELEALVGGTGCRVSDMKEFIDLLHEKGVYVIGRVTVFQDPYLADVAKPEWAVKRASDGGVWKDRKGLSFIDVGAREYWDFVVELSKESYELGFDEINFDYIRYPSDGNLTDIAFTHSGHKEKEDALEDFFAYLHTELKNTGLKTSADIFGMTTTAEDDMNIGQILERTLPYFDYVAPMVYPSHYPAHFNGWANPNTVPYELIKFVMESAVVRAESPTTKLVLQNAEKIPIYEGLASTSTSTPKVLRYEYKKPVWSREKFRTWIQDFDYGGDYGPAEVHAQIQGSYDAGVDSWMLWDPNVRYTKEALLAE